MSMANNQRHPARGAANYAGDHRHVVGTVMGPTTYGALLIATGAEFNAETGRTRVTFSHATEADVAAATR